MKPVGSYREKEKEKQCSEFAAQLISVFTTTYVMMYHACMHPTLHRFAIHTTSTTQMSTSSRSPSCIYRGPPLSFNGQHMQKRFMHLHGIVQMYMHAYPKVHL